MSAARHQQHDWALNYDWNGGPSSPPVLQCVLCNETRDVRCYFDGCVATWRHWHGFLPGGCDNPNDPTGVPIIFTGNDPEPGAVRDYNGASLPTTLGPTPPGRREP